MMSNEEFNRYSIAYYDWSSAQNYLLEIKKHIPNNIIYEALLISLIIYYYKPFSPNEIQKNSPSTSSLKIEDFMSITPEELDLHEMLKAIRNKAVAHSEFSYNPTGINSHTRIICSKPYSVLNEAINFSALEALLHKLLETVHAKRGDFAAGQA